MKKSDSSNVVSAVVKVLLVYVFTFSERYSFRAQWLLGTLLIAALSTTPAIADTITIDANGVKDLNNLKMIALALNNYNDAFLTFPAEFLSSGGTPLLSWRVALLPFLGQAALFAQFDLSKAWNDPANLPLLQDMPDVYRSPLDPASSTITRYAGGSGPGTMFEGANGVRIATVTDGTSNTILIGETEGSAIPWTAPTDIPIGTCPVLGGNGFSSFVPGAVPFAFVDGSVGFLRNGIDCATLSGLFIRNDGFVDPAARLGYVATPEPAGPVLLVSLLVVLAGRKWRAKSQE